MKSMGAKLAGWDEDRTIDLEPPPETRQRSPLPGSTPAAGTTTSQTTPRAEPRPAPVLAAGTKLLRGRYMLVRPIGSGGTSVVYCARDLRRDEAGLEAAAHVALKILRPELNKDPRAVARLEREFACTQALSHPNIVRVFDLDCHQDSDGERWFLTMELLEGELLGDLLKRTAPSPLPGPSATGVLRACGNALAFAHDHGIVHGDFKPGNVFITRQGRICLLDFGASASDIADGVGQVARSATPAYASPEVLAGQKPERRDDVFAFGCVAYQLLTGQHPFVRHSPATWSEDPLRSWNLTDRQWFALQSALSRRREERPQDLRRLLADLMPVEAAVAAPVHALDKPPFRSRAATLTPLVTIGALLVLGAGFLLFGSKPGVDAPDKLVEQGEQTKSPAAAANVAATTSAKPVEPPVPQPAQPQSKKLSITPPSKPAPASPAGSSQSTVPAKGVGTKALAEVAQPKRPSSQISATIPGGWISLGAMNFTASESAPAAVLMLDRYGNISGRTQVRWRIVPGTAQPGRDFGGLTMSGTAEFVDGQTKRAIYIPLVNDKLAERNKTFTVDLYDPSGQTRIGPNARATVTIRDDD